MANTRLRHLSLHSGYTKLHCNYLGQKGFLLVCILERAGDCAKPEAFVVHIVLSVCPTCVLAHVWFEFNHRIVWVGKDL